MLEVAVVAVVALIHLAALVAVVLVRMVAVRVYQLRKLLVLTERLIQAPVAAVDLTTV
jgi:hypothetical protein